MNTDKIIITAIIAFGIAAGAALAGGAADHSSWKAGLIPFGTAVVVGDPIVDHDSILHLPDAYHQLLGI
jgi:hypothetical protein